MIKKKNKIIYFLLIVSLLIFVSGCKKKEADIQNMSNTHTISEDNPLSNIDVNASGYLLCTRDAMMPTGMTGEFKYSVTYKDGVITVLHSMEKVVSETSSQLDEYENAYNNIKDRYKGIKYYDVTVSRDNNSVTYDSNINYGKINFDELIDIEGNEYNLYDDNKMLLKTWYSFAKQSGMTCEGVVN